MVNAIPPATYGGKLPTMAPSYWLDLFSVETWQEFLDHGGDVSGFGEGRWKTVQRMRPGDRLLCYLTRASRWVGILEVKGPAFYAEDPIWSSQPFPSRVPVEIVIALKPENGVPVLDMRDELSVFQGLENPNRWSGPFRGSPARWKTADGEAVHRAVIEAQAHPVERPLGRLRRTSTVTVASVTVADEDDQITVPDDDEVEAEDTGRPSSMTAEVQYLLLRLGADMGFDVHVARNDQSRDWNGHRFGDVPRRRERLPQSFDPKTQQTIELIDVLWLQGNAFVAAFEIESTTAVYSGLLRMSDLLSLQPNISVPLFLVAPEDRRPKVINEINRPTFARMKPPLVDICRYISFEGLKESLEAACPYVKVLKSDWLQMISESCALDEA
jgi:hypothetical protein